MEKSLSRITLIYQLTGVQYFHISPETVEATKTSHQNVNRKFKLIFLANMLIVLSEIFGIIFAVHLEEMQNRPIDNAVTGQIVQIVSYNFTIIAFLITILNSFFGRNKAKQIFKNCKIISNILLTLNQHTNYGSVEKEFTRTFAKLGVCFIGSTMATGIFIFHYNQTNVYW